MNNGWIDVNDRLPEPYKEVLVWVAYKECFAIADHYGGAFSDEHSNDLNVTHWQPLPPPPPHKQKNRKDDTST